MRIEQAAQKVFDGYLKKAGCPLFLFQMISWIFEHVAFFLNPPQGVKVYQLYQKILNKGDEAAPPVRGIEKISFLYPEEFSLTVTRHLSPLVCLHAAHTFLSTRQDFAKLPKRMPTLLKIAASQFTQTTLPLIAVISCLKPPTESLRENPCSSEAYLKQSGLHFFYRLDSVRAEDLRLSESRQAFLLNFREKTLLILKDEKNRWAVLDPWHAEKKALLSPCSSLDELRVALQGAISAESPMDIQEMVLETVHKPRSDDLRV